MDKIRDCGSLDAGSIPAGSTNYNMKNFFYLQYNKINWKNQEKTKINSLINDYIIENIISKHRDDNISIFDIGFGVGFFFKMILSKLKGKYKKILIEGCEPSDVNYNYFLKEKISNEIINSYNNTFQDVKTNRKFHFITAIHVFIHFLSEDLDSVVKKIHSMIRNKGKFILVVAEEKYIENKLKKKKNLLIKKRNITYNNRRYKELLHYTDIPKVGKTIDYNREEEYYISLFKDNNFKLKHKENLEDNGFICTILVFEKI